MILSDIPLQSPHTQYPYNANTSMSLRATRSTKVAKVTNPRDARAMSRQMAWPAPSCPQPATATLKRLRAARGKEACASPELPRSDLGNLLKRRRADVASVATARTKAATRIQAAVRMGRGRSRFTALKVSVVRMQAAVRMRQERARFTALKARMAGVAYNRPLLSSAQPEPLLFD